MAAAAAAAVESPHPLVKVTDIPGRGRSLVATRDIKSGEIILSDSPLLLYPAASTATTSFCSHCFRTLNPNNTPRCSSCSSLFCSPRCLSLHPKPLCQTLTQLSNLHSRQNHDPESINQTNFLISAYSLSLSSPSDFQRLLSLQPSPTLTPTAQLASPFPPDLTAALLARDLANAFGLLEPSHQQQRSVRAYGIYPLASFFNHDCLPNACRFDYVDSPAGNNTDIIIRAIHDIPQGREVCLSYFPVNWPYKDRQKRLAEDYGFRCECDRCRVEMNWKDDDDGGDDEAMEEEGSNDEGMEEEEDGGDFPHAYFFVRYLCDRENCGGTLAPLPPSPEGVPSDMLECNVCGKLRKEEDDGNGEMEDDE